MDSKVFKTERNFVPRHQRLRQLEGWYEVEEVPSEWHPLYSEWSTCGTKLTFTRWLIRKEKATPTQVSSLGEKLKKMSFKISCSRRDILRLGVSDHNCPTRYWISCYRPGGAHEEYPKWYCFVRDIAILYVPDEAGNFKMRINLLLCHTGRELCILAIRPYGNGPWRAILNRLAQEIPVFVRDLDWHHFGIGSSPKQTIQTASLSTTGRDKGVRYGIATDLEHHMAIHSNCDQPLKNPEKALGEYSFSNITPTRWIIPDVCRFF